MSQTFKFKALEIVHNSNAELVKKEFVDQFYGEIHRYLLKNELGDLYFSITNQSWVPMRWGEGFDEKILARMFDQKVARRTLRWDLIGENPEQVLDELEIRLQAVSQYRRKNKRRKAA